MFTDIVWRFLLLEMFVMGALCCQCRDNHPQRDFCKREFVLKVEIKQKVKSPTKTYFWMEIKQVFKGDFQRNLKDNPSRILDMCSKCPIDAMKTGDTYLIFGDKKNQHIYTTACYGSMPWRKTTAFQRQALETYYKTNCNCYPTIKDYTKQFRCKRNYSFRRKYGSNCRWANTSNFQLCTNGLLNGR